MRKILFRGKHIDSGEWIYGSLILHHEHADIARPHGFIYDTSVRNGVDPKTVGQYVGKIGDIDIWEGDVFQHPDGTKFVKAWLEDAIKEINNETQD